MLFRTIIYHSVARRLGILCQLYVNGNWYAVEDVDEVQFVDSSTGQFDVNAVVEGDEFQRSILTGNFTAPHYHDATASPLFWDEFDARHRYLDNPGTQKKARPPRGG